MNLEALFTLHCGLPREGPGNDDTTQEAIRRLPASLREKGAALRVFDMGCGPGKQTLVLARTLQATIAAVDFHQPYLDQLRQSAEQAGLSHLIETRCALMENLGEPPGSVDLIWAEGSIYIIGFAKGLELWRELLRDDGAVVASELTWLTENVSGSVPDEARAFWQEAYPPMTTIQGNIANAASVGYEVFDHLILPRYAWWDEYMSPLSDRSAQLRKTATDPELIAVLDEQDRETDIVRRFGDYFGYVFYLMKKAVRS